MPANRIKGILFDKDGTLFDFQGTWRSVIDGVLEEIAPDPAARTRMARAAGYDPETRRFAPGSVIVAGTASEVAEIWSAHCPGLSVTEIEDIANAAATAIVEAPGGMVPAAADLPLYLRTLKREGYLLGVATHDSHGAAIAQLRAFGIEQVFDFIAGYDSGHGLKPGPGMLDAFARHCRIEAAAVAMVGDSIHDLLMARNAKAGMAVGVLTGPAAAEDLAALAHHVLASIEDLPELLRGHAGGGS